MARQRSVRLAARRSSAFRPESTEAGSRLEPRRVEPGRSVNVPRRQAERNDVAEPRATTGRFRAAAYNNWGHRATRSHPPHGEGHHFSTRSACGTILTRSVSEAREDDR